MRASLLDGAGLDVLIGYVIPLLVSGVVAIPFGLLVFRWGERYAKRTGRLARDG
jgi:ABC-2 type transport system permease protein